MPSPLRIWCSQQFPPAVADDLRRRAAPHALVASGATQASNLVAAGRDPALAAGGFDGAFGQPHVDDCLEAPDLRLVHLTSAGYTRFDRNDVRAAFESRGVMLCTASTVYADPCAQHAAAMMLALARQLPAACRSQFETRGWPYLELRGGSRLLTGRRALLVGYGAIAKRLAELLAPYRMDLIAFRRGVRGDEAVRTLPIEQLDEHLPSADHVVNILPANPTTAGLFGAERFARMRPGAAFYNIGRGDTVDQDALVAALRDGPLSAAYLDVTSPEPLPPGHPLWHLPNCHITPHTAGGFDAEAEAQVEHFLDNLGRLERGEALVDRVI